MYQVIAIHAFSDNYLWALVNDNGNCAIVDPGDAEPVLAFLKQHNYTLTDILLTHHHSDHIGGVNQLLTTFPDNHINVYGPNTARFQMVNKPCNDNDTIHLPSLNATLTIIETPGHTLDHICYFDQQNLFSGDTLFSVGCGRLFEGTPEQMHQSLTKIMALDKTTNIYCAHEYTLANIDFALAVEPENLDLINYQEQAKQLRANNKPTIPTTLATQLTINPFLRSQIPRVKQSIQKQFNLNGTISELECFTHIRKWKDTF